MTNESIFYLPWHPGSKGEKIYDAPDINAALEFIKSLQLRGKYQYFRGQENSEWLPMPSYSRLPEDAIEETNVNVKSFLHYARKVSESTGLNYTDDDLIAIAQHYGVPTPFLDLTTEPIVAASFACPSGSKNTAKKASIFLYSKLQIQFWRDYYAKNGIELVYLDTANLWRLEAQRGLFLWIAVHNACDHFMPDRVEFSHPEGGFLDSNFTLYPKEKSELEIQIDLYFNLVEIEKRKKEAKEFLPNVIHMDDFITLHSTGNSNVTNRISTAIKNCSDDWIKDELALHKLLRDNVNNIVNHPLRTLPDGYHQTNWKYRNDILYPHKSWFNQDAMAWLQTDKEGYKFARANESDNIEIDLSSFGVLGVDLGNLKILNIFDPAPSLRQKSLDFKISYKQHPLQDQKNIDRLSERLNKCSLEVKNIWDGIRNKPVSDALVGICINRILAYTKISIDITEKTSISSFFSLFGNRNEDFEKVEFLGLGGHSQNVQILNTDLARAIRSDFNEVVEIIEEYPINGFPHLRQMLLPQYLFDFEKFVYLNYSCIIPFQAVLKVDIPTWSVGYYFNPRQIKVFGIA